MIYYDVSYTSIDVILTSNNAKVKQKDIYAKK